MRIAVALLMIMLLTGCAATKQTPASDRYSAAERADIYIQLGIKYLEQGKRERAKQKLLMALKSDKKNSKVHSALGLFYETVGETNQADNHYRQAIAYAKSPGAAHNNYGTFLCRHQHYQEAIDYFVKAATEPQYLKVAKAYENAGLCALEIPDNQRAFDFFTKALRHDPNAPEALLYMSQNHFIERDYQRAEHYLNRLFDMTKPNKTMLTLAVSIYQKLGDESAANYYQEQLNDE